MTYNKVFLACLYNQNDIVEITDVNETNYRKAIANLQVPAESLVGRQIKPCFDADPKDGELLGDTMEEDQLARKRAILDYFPEANITLDDIYVIKREYQTDDGKTKYSSHYTVDKIRMSRVNILTMLQKNNNPANFDLKVYKCGKFLTSIYTNKKVRDGKKITLPPFMPVGNAHITKYLVSYIEEDFVNYDLNFPPPKKKSVLEQINEACDKLKVRGNKIVKVDEDGNDEDEDNEKDVKMFMKYIEKVCCDLDIKRVGEYDEWIKVMFALINVCKKKKISSRDCRNILHKVSEKSKKYDEGSVEKWINTNYEKVNDKLGLNYLINVCIKEDNYTLWCDDYEKPSYNTVKKRFEKHCFFCINNIIYIDINEECDEINQDVFYMLNQKDLKAKYGHLTYYEKRVDKKGKWEIREKQFITKWITDPKIKKYQSVCFVPKELDEQFKTKHYNMFSGFKASLKPVKRNYEVIQLFLNHIKDVLVKGNEEHYNWLIQYFANLIQNPDKKSCVVIIFQGIQGAGKSIVVDTFYKNIIGDDYGVSTSSPDRDFFGNFNSKLCNKVFSVINEAGNELRQCMDKIKDLSVSPCINIEKKGKDPITFNNYNNFIGTTNNMNPLDVAWDDRRFAWFNVDSKYVKNQEYFDALTESIAHEDFDSSLYHYLKEEINITITNFQNTRPQTQEYEDIKKRNLPNVIKFLADRYKKFYYRKGRGEEGNISCIEKKELYFMYKNYCEACKYTAYNFTAFKSYMKTVKGVSELLSHGQSKYKFKEVDFEDYIKDYDDDNDIDIEEIETDEE